MFDSFGITFGDDDGKTGTGGLETDTTSAFPGLSPEHGRQLAFATDVKAFLNAGRTAGEDDQATAEPGWGANAWQGPAPHPVRQALLHDEATRLSNFMVQGKNSGPYTLGEAITSEQGPGGNAPRDERMDIPSPGEQRGDVKTLELSRNYTSQSPTQQSQYTLSKNNPAITSDERAKARVEYAKDQLSKNSKSWSYFANAPFQMPSNKCNEFVYSVHVNGDPEGEKFPTTLREDGYFKPNVSDLADERFAAQNLELDANIDNVRPGDIVVWYHGGVHHSAIATGNGKVIYAGSEGIKENDIRNVYPGVVPIIRRYK